MFGSDTLEVAIGVVFVYLLVSLLCTAIRELIEAALKSRATDLERGITELLRNGTLTAALYRHPLVNALYAGEYEPPSGRSRASVNLPSYIPARNFALALLDMAARGRPLGPVDDADDPTPRSPDGVAAAPAAAGAYTRGADAEPDAPAITIETLRAGLGRLENADVQRVVLTALDTAEGDLVAVRASLEAWYNSAMDRVAGWYKRRTQKILLILGVAGALAGNVNTITIATYLYRTRAARTSVDASAAAYVQEQRYRGVPPASTDVAAGTPASAGPSVPPHASTDTAAAPPPGPEVPGATPVRPVGDAFARVAARTGDLAALSLPIGWGPGHGWAVPGPDGTVPGSTTGLSWWRSAAGWWSRVLAPVLGLLLTGLAVTLGAPFWFDVLNKIMVVRSTVKPDEKSPDEASKDQWGSEPRAARDAGVARGNVAPRDVARALRRGHRTPGAHELARLLPSQPATGPHRRPS